MLDLMKKYRKAKKAAVKLMQEGKLSEYVNKLFFYHNFSSLQKKIDLLQSFYRWPILALCFAHPIFLAFPYRH